MARLTAHPPRSDDPPGFRLTDIRQVGQDIIQPPARQAIRYGTVQYHDTFLARHVDQCKQSGWQSPAAFATLTPHVSIQV